MSRRLFSMLGGMAVACAAIHDLRAQTAPALPPVHQLGAPIAASHDTLSRIWGLVRQLSDGRVMVNDIGKRRVLVFDPTLAHAVVIADSTATTNKAYGGANAAIIAYRADSTMLIDPRAVAMLVIDPRGAIVRTIAPPQPGNVGSLALPFGNAGFDAHGRLVYHDLRATCGASGACGMGRPPQPPPVANAADLPGWAVHDSAPVLRADLATHAIDTIAFLATQLLPRQVGSASSDGWITMWVGNPTPIFDDAVVVSDGSLAILRALDYHLDWIAADGSRASTPKIAHEWHRLTDSDKVRYVDSMRVYLDSSTKLVRARAAQSDSIARLNGQPSNFPKVLFAVPEVSDIPDYTPPVAQSSLLADADNRVWIKQTVPRPTFGARPPDLYDVVDRLGRLVDRVAIPAGSTIVGFGPGVVYLSAREGTGTEIARYHIPWVRHLTSAYAPIRLPLFCTCTPALQVFDLTGTQGAEPPIRPWVPILATKACGFAVRD